MNFAIIGAGFHFPGQIGSLQDLHPALIRKKTLYQATAGDFSGASFKSGKPIGCLSRPDLFDASFFGMSPAEAEQLDPQTRVLLELSIRAFENGNIDFQKLNPSMVGVYASAAFTDYRDCIHDSSHGNEYTISGNTLCSISGRLSYHLNFTGPSLTIDTACSASLVALHYCCNDLSMGETETGLVAGVNIILSEKIHSGFESLRALSPNGVIRPFDKRADGYVRSEGGGVLILKALDKAVRDGNRILAVIRSTAVNNDGHSRNFVSPNKEAQSALIRKALEKAGLEPGDIDCIEAHGTGTPVGDPLELQAISDVFNKKSRKRKIYVGSVKGNTGHLETASGMAGIAKAMLMAGNRMVYGNAGFSEPTDKFDWASGCLEVPVDAIPAGGERMIVGINSFGISGTNAHVILESPPPLPEKIPITLASVPVLTLSAQDITAYETLTGAYEKLLTEAGEEQAGQIVAATLTGRPSWRFRRAFVHRQQGELIKELSLREPPVRSADGAGTVFVFSGQGGQWPGMGLQLLEKSSVFREKLTECDKLFRDTGYGSVLDRLIEGLTNDNIHKARIIQPVLFSLHIAWARLLQSAGIMPAAVIGHSLGEISAACVAGLISLEQAVRIVYARSVAVSDTAGDFGMILAGADEEHCEAILSGAEIQLELSACNSRNALVYSGATPDLVKFGRELDGKSVFNRIIRVDYASHSSRIEQALPAFRENIRGIKPAQGTVPFYSSSRNAWESCTDTEFWVQNLRSPVRFYQSIQALCREGFNLFTEFSPHSLLSSLIEQTAEEEGSAVHASCLSTRGSDDWLDLLKTCGDLYEKGLNPDWQRLLEFPATPFVELPPYPWQKGSYWFTPVDSSPEPVKNSGPEKEACIAASQDVYSLPELTAHIRQIVSACLKLPLRKLKDDESFRDLGFDSLMALRVKTKIESELHINCPIAHLWSFPTIEQLAARLFENFKKSDRPNAEAKTFGDIVKDLDRILEDI